MASNFELNLPTQTTPTKIMAVNTNNLLSSPMSVQSGAEAAVSMINTGGVHIASLKTPTKGMAPQNIAPKHPISISPSKLYIKQNAAENPGGYQVVQNHSSSSGAVPAYHSVANNANGRVQYVRVVANQANGQSATGHHQPIVASQVRAAHTVVANGTYQQHQPLQQQQQQHSISHQHQNTYHQHHMHQPHRSAASLAPANRQTVQGNTSQRVILPAGTSQSIRLSGTQSLAHIKSQLPPGTTILSNTDPNGQMVAFLPSNHTVVHRAPVVKQVYTGIPQHHPQPHHHQQALLRAHDIVRHDPIQEIPQINVQSSTLISTSAVPADTSKQKKPCNCTKSQCLKLYCDCFANGEFCSNCNCQNCFNNLNHEEERQKAVKQCLERNPQAFHPKIGKGAKADARRHQKGCNCKRSGCLKNYCECYEAKIPCGSMCKCVGCKNCESSNESSRSLMHLADAADLRQSQLSASSYKVSHDLQSPALESSSPHTYLKKSVVEAIMDCLIAQCREAENARCNDSTTEKVILEEYGRCLNELIRVSSANKQ